MLKLTPIDSRLEIQCNTVPNNNAFANVYQDIFPFKNNRNSSRARQPLFRGNVTGFTTPIESLSLTHTHTHANFFKNWLCQNFFCCPTNVSCPLHFGGASATPLRSLAHMPMELFVKSSTLVTELIAISTELCPFLFHFKSNITSANYRSSPKISNNVLSVDPFPLSSESEVMFKRLARKLIL